MKKLHQLIHSLSKSEKRVVKMRLNSSKSGSLLNKYFDALCKQNTYDFEGVQKDGGKSVTLTKSNLSLLFDVVLKHLRSNENNKDVDVLFRNYLLDVKTLKEKGFYDEAKRRCEKLIKKTQEREEFSITREAFNELWNIHLFQSNLSTEFTEEIQNELDSLEKQEKEVRQLESIYRKATSIYYQFFFKKRDSELKKVLLLVTDKLQQTNFLSDKAKHVFFETKCIEIIILGDIEAHHEIRQKQLLLLFNSMSFEFDHLHRVLVMSHLFVKLKSKGLINELKAYLELFKLCFSVIIEKEKDNVLTEKYYDIHFTNNVYLQVWYPNKQAIRALEEELKLAIEKKWISNSTLISRIYLSVVELNVLSEDYKLALPLLVEFFDFSKKSKYSAHYIEGEIHFLFAQLLLENTDVFENSLDSLNRKIRRYDIELKQDKLCLIELLNAVQNSSVKTSSYYLAKITSRPTFRLYIEKICSRKSMVELRLKQFEIKDVDYKEENDVYINELKKFI